MIKCLQAVVSVSNTVITPMGHTSARVIQASEPDTAFVLCGPECCRLSRTDVGDPTVRSDLESIWFTNPITPGLQQSSITAMVQIPSWPGPEECNAYASPEGCLFTISGSSIAISQLDSEIEAVPRQLRLKDTPYKLMYYDRMKMMIVAATRVREKPGKKRHGKGFRSIRSVIQLIRLDDSVANKEMEIEDPTTGVPKAGLMESLVAAEYVLLSRERVYAMLEWRITNEGKQHAFVVVGAGTTGSNGDSSGRLIFCRYDNDPRGKSSFHMTKAIDHKSPVFAIALYDERRLLYTCGKMIHMIEFDLYHLRYNEPQYCRLTEGPLMTTRWKELIQLELPSAGIQITVDRERIFVATAQDSVYGLDFDLSADNPYTLRVFMSDGQTRDCLNHITIPLPSSLDRSAQQEASTANSTLNTLVLVSDKSCSLAGLLVPTTTTIKNAAPTIFNAQLPRSITRLRRGDVRPRWRREYPTSFHPSASPTLLPTGILADDILGTASDGSLLAFSVLSPAAFTLLSFLEKLIRAHGAAPPYRPSRDRARPLRLKDLKIPARLKPEDMHVDGDLLVSRIVEAKRPVDVVMGLVGLGVEGEEIGAAFEGIVKAMGLVEDMEVLGEEMCRQVVRWLGRVLDGVL